MESYNTKRITIKHLTVDGAFEGQRIDNYLFNKLNGVPKTRIYKGLRKGEVRVNKGRKQPSYKLKAGDIIRVPFETTSKKQDESSYIPKHLSNLENHILYEDSHIIVINKPPKVAVHGGSGINVGLIEALRKLRPEEENLELVHRLDRDTSGCLLVSKKRSTLRALHEDFRTGNVDKRYLALVDGIWDKSVNTINLPLEKSHLTSGERIVRVTNEGSPSITKVRVVKHYKDLTLVEAKPITGRTHQIRVHLSVNNHPIALDDKYGDREFDKRLKTVGLNRMFLHCQSLTFKHPNLDKEIKIEAKLSQELQNVLDNLEKDI